MNRQSKKDKTKPAKTHRPKLKPIPDFKSEDEEREFWATHSSTDYFDWSKAEEAIFPNLKRSKIEDLPRVRILELFAYYYEGVLLYPKRVERQKLGMFSSTDKLKEPTSRYIMESQEYQSDSAENKETTLFFIAFESILDSDHYDQIRKYVFDASGNFYGSANLGTPIEFHGRTEYSCRHKVGDIVHFLDWDVLQLGIIAHLPPTPEFAMSLKVKGSDSLALDQSDDTYLVLYGQEEHSHSHLAECDIFPAQDEITQEAKELLINRLKQYQSSNR